MRHKIFGKCISLRVKIDKSNYYFQHGVIIPKQTRLILHFDFSLLLHVLLLDFHFLQHKGNILSVHSDPISMQGTLK